MEANANFNLIRDSLASARKVCDNSRGDPLNLDNGISARPTVQETRTIIAPNGCSVTLLFSDESVPEVQRDIAKMLIEAFENARRNRNEEACRLPVQSIDQATGESGR